MARPLKKDIFCGFPKGKHNFSRQDFAAGANNSFFYGFLIGTGAQSSFSGRIFRTLRSGTAKILRGIFVLNENFAGSYTDEFGSYLKKKHFSKD